MSLNDYVLQIIDVLINILNDQHEYSQVVKKAYVIKQEGSDNLPTVSS